MTGRTVRHREPAFAPWSRRPMTWGWCASVSHLGRRPRSTRRSCGAAPCALECALGEELAVVGDVIADLCRGRQVGLALSQLTCGSNCYCRRLEVISCLWIGRCSALGSRCSNRVAPGSVCRPTRATGSRSSCSSTAGPGGPAEAAGTRAAARGLADMALTCWRCAARSSESWPNRLARPRRGAPDVWPFARRPDLQAASHYGPWGTRWHSLIWTGRKRTSQLQPAMRVRLGLKPPGQAHAARLRGRPDAT